MCSLSITQKNEKGYKKFHFFYFGLVSECINIGIKAFKVTIF